MNSSFYFPGWYYIVSRYNGNIIKFVFYLFRYWFFIYFAFISECLDTNSILIFCYFLLLYYGIYDLLCFKNDSISASEKNGTNRQVVFSYEKKRSSYAWIIILVLFGILNQLVVWNIVLILTGVILTFILHNKLNPKYRVLTYSCLYFLKIDLVIFSVPYDCLIALLNFKHLFLLPLLWNFTYIVTYFRKKHSLTALKREKIEIIRWTTYVVVFGVFQISASLFILLIVIYGLEWLVMQKKIKIA